MPFIPEDERLVVDRIPLANRTSGQRCFIHYRWMIKKWNQNPRWTTADEIYRYVRLPQPITSSPKVDDDEQRAKELAWQVFFKLHVMPYELEKKAENGDI